MKRPGSLGGLHHVALWVKDLEACERFYCETLGMHVEWRPDADNVYLTGGSDNLALHRAPADFAPGAHQRLDHIGFIITDIGAVDAWYAFMRANGVPIEKEPKTHRDGARSFYCRDPDENVVQLIYHPPLVPRR
jgi:catechol 2,3-dioxygenase-like lactoylglutathione lyase family enzyme